jgi:4-alpha-glucanotransferase
VIELRDRLELPGMKILQFAFSTDASDKFLPHNYTRNFVVYSGTHDNDTSWGWYRTTANDHERDSLPALLCAPTATTRRGR